MLQITVRLRVQQREGAGVQSINKRDVALLLKYNEKRCKMTAKECRDYFVKKRNEAFRRGAPVT